MGFSWQLRAELELPDAPTVVAPPGWRWSNACFWVVNSDGTANDPQRQLVKHGGQFHTPVARSAEDLAGQCEAVLKMLRPVPNYRSSMRIAVQVPQLQHDVAALAALTSYTRAHLPRLWQRVDPLDAILTGANPAVPAEAKGAHARLTALLRARHYLVPEAMHRTRLDAATIADFVRVPPVDAREGNFGAQVRECVDVQQVHDDGWITFRCFAQAATGEEIHQAALFVLWWIGASLNNTPSARQLGPLGSLPRQLPYSHRLEQSWKYLNFHHHARRTVAARLAQRGLL